jgi:hypothetical protein
MFRGVGDVLPAAPLVTARCSTYWCQVSSACPFVPERQNVPKKVSKPYGFDRSTTKRPVSCQLLSFCGEAKSLPLRASLSHASALIASGAEDPQELCQAVPSSQDVGGAPRAFKFQQRAKTYANSRYARKQISKCDVVSLDHEVAMSFLMSLPGDPADCIACALRFWNVLDSSGTLLYTLTYLNYERKLGPGDKAIAARAFANI